MASDDIASQARQASFVYPKADTAYVFNSIDTVNTSWTSTYEQPLLQLWCKLTDRKVRKSRYQANVESTGSHPVLLNFGTGGDCNFAISDAAHPERALNSAYFDVQVAASDASAKTYGASSDPAPTQSTDQPPSATATSSTPDSSPPQPTSTAPEPISSTSTPHGGGMSIGAGVGTGIGVAVGASMLIALAIYLFLRRRRRRRSSSDKTVKEVAEQEHSIAVQRDMVQTNRRRTAPPLEVPSSQATVAMTTGQLQEAATEPPGQELESPHTTQALSTGSRSNGRTPSGGGSNVSVREMHVEAASEIDSIPLKWQRLAW